jgi:hypothetical protein
LEIGRIKISRNHINYKEWNWKIEQYKCIWINNDFASEWQISCFSVSVLYIRQWNKLLSSACLKRLTLLDYCKQLTRFRYLPESLSIRKLGETRDNDWKHAIRRCCIFTQHKIMSRGKYTGDWMGEYINTFSLAKNIWGKCMYLRQ